MTALAECRWKPAVIYEDNHLLVLNKPARMPVVPDRSGDLSLLEWGRHYLKVTRDKKGNVFLGVVHRLDRPVSGIVCFAATSKAAARLSEQMRKKNIKKTYVGLSDHKPCSRGGVLRHWVFKDRQRNRVSLSVSRPDGKKAVEAVTFWRYAGMADGLYRLVLYPETGRSHQLRAQCASMGCPLAGDRKYGSRAWFEKGRIALHAEEFTIEHPVRRESMTFMAPAQW